MMNFAITLTIYCQNQPSYFPWDDEKKYKYYEPIGRIELPEKEFESIWHVELWALEQFGANGLGASCHATDGSPNFAIACDPSYWEHYFETTNWGVIVDKRIEELKGIIERER